MMHKECYSLDDFICNRKYVKVNFNNNMEISMKKHKRTLEDLKNSTLIPAMLVPEKIPVSLATVRSWIFQGKLPVVKIGRMVFIRREVIEKIEMEGLESVTMELNNNQTKVLKG